MEGSVVTARGGTALIPLHSDFVGLGVKYLRRTIKPEGQWEEKTRNTWLPKSHSHTDGTKQIPPSPVPKSRCMSTSTTHQNTSNPHKEQQKRRNLQI